MPFVREEGNHPIVVDKEKHWEAIDRAMWGRVYVQLPCTISPATSWWCKCSFCSLPMGEHDDACLWAKWLRAVRRCEGIAVCFAPDRRLE